MFNCYFDLVMFETILVQSDAVWHHYDDCRITANACVLLLVSPTFMCYLTITNAIAFVTCVLPVLLPLPCPICPSLSLLLLYFILSHMNILFFSAGHKAQHYEALHGRTLSRQVWPHGLLWDLWAGSQRRVSLLFFFHFNTSNEWTYISHYIANIWLISLNISLLCPATFLLLWTTEVGCPATAPSSYIRSDHVLSFILDRKTWKFAFFMFVQSCEGVTHETCTSRLE